MLTHYASLAEDMAELGARYNAFSLSEQSSTLATAIEKMGQAVDSTYVKTRDLSSELSAHFAEPMRESAQFAGVVRNVLRYRVFKRVQEQMTEDELKKKKELLASLNEQEEQSKRMAATLSGYTTQSPSTPKRSISSASSRMSQESARKGEEDVASVDSDFPPTIGDASPPSAPQGLPQGSEPSSPTHNHKKSGSTGGNFMSNKIFGRISHAFHGVVDSDPVKTRHDLIGKTSEQVEQLTEALKVVKTDVKDASRGVLEDLKRFQGEKEEDLKRYMVRLSNSFLIFFFGFVLTMSYRLPTHTAISPGQKTISHHGRRRRTKWRTFKSRILENKCSFSLDRLLVRYFQEPDCWCDFHPYPSVGICRFDINQHCDWCCSDELAVV